MLKGTENAPGISCSKVRLKLGTEELYLEKKGLFQTSVTEKEWTDSMELMPGKSYSNVVDIYVKDDYVPTEVKVNFPVEVFVESEGREYSDSCEIPVANLDIQPQRAVAKKTNFGGTGNKVKSSFQELLSKGTLTLDSILDYYLDNKQKGQVLDFLTAWVGTVMMSVEEEAQTEANSYEAKIVDKLFQKAGVNVSAMLFMKTTQASVEMTASTAKYGKRTFVFSLEMSSFSIGQGKPFGSKGDISYQLKSTKGIPGNIPTSGLGMVTETDFITFAGHLQSAADDAIQDAYDEVWGKNANKVAAVVLNKTLMAAIDKEYGSFSNGVFQLITKPSKNYVKKHSVHCPVDVYIYDSSGDLCGAVVDGQVDPAYNDIYLYVEGDAKYFYLTGDDYQVKLVGNDTGNMAYTVEECNGDLECLRTIKYQDVPLSDGKTYYSMSTESVFADTSLYDLVSDIEELIQADADDYAGTTGERIFVSGISLNKDSCQMKEGETVCLSAKITPSDATIQTVRWSSSDNNIASVGEDGTVKAEKQGSTKITAVTYDGGLRAECMVTVLSSEESITGTTSGKNEIRVNSINISAPSKRIAAGKKVKLTAGTLPANATNKNVLWQSSNKKYVTVNSMGVVTTRKAGKGKTVTITATAMDGSNVKAAIKIKIMKHAVKKVTIKRAPKDLKAGKKVTLKATVETNGKNANKKLKWSSSNSRYAKVNSKGKVTAMKAGKGKKVTITAASTDGTGKKAKVKIRIK